MLAKYVKVLALVLMLAGGTAARGQDPVRPDRESTRVPDEQIRRLVAELSASSFKVREHASQQLWDLGEQAREVLERASRDPDLEIRIRAGRILLDFEYGVMPSVEPRL